MKKVLALLGLFFLFAPAAGASTFENANAEYQKGNFKEAAELYRRLTAAEGHTSAVQYNLANAYLRSGQKAKALAAYERARALAPRDPDIRWNLAVLKSSLEDRITPQEGNVFLFWIREWTDKFTVNEIALVFSAALGLWFLAGLLGFLWPKAGLKGPRTLALLLVLAAGAFFYFKWQEVRHPRVVVLDKEVSVRYGPSNRETKAFTLHEGAEAAVMDEAKEWYNVALADGKSGWVPKASCEII